jgi:hypothetical protein
MTSRLRAALTRVNVPDAASYTIRSDRSGRRTDLQNAQVGDEVVNSLGRWSNKTSNNAYRRMTATVMSQLPTGQQQAGSTQSTTTKF